MSALNKVSIIVPIYNASRYLPQTIESLLCQTYRNIELILVDDGSTDDSLAICHRYKTDSRVHIIHQENGGLSCARNTGISNASGDYIGFVDADDVAHPQMFALLLEALLSTHSEISMCRMVYGGKVVFPNITHEHQKPVKEFGKRQFFRHFFGISNHRFTYTVVWNKLYCKSAIHDFSFRSDIHCEDVDFIIRNRDSITKIAYIDTPLIYYRVHGDSLSHSSSSTAKIISDNIKYLEYFSPDDEITSLFIQKAWMEALAVRHNSVGSVEEDDVRELYHTWRLESKKSGETSALQLWKRLAIKTMDYCPALYTLYLKLRQLL